ncbi:MAG: HAD hydrolase-like protein [Bacteroidetes bacterium]|nr:HAD hydrolase-like protein [Bacteroidota bacterium]
MSVIDKFKEIRILLFDMDGVLTDGTVLVTPTELLRTMHTRDGSAITRAVKQGFELGIISAGFSQSAHDRFVGFGMQHIYMEAKPKWPVFKQILAITGFQPAQVLYMGDDIADMQCLHAAGIGVAPHDACQDVLAMADHITQHRGGHGAVREVIELVLRSQGKWELPSLTHD